MNDDCVFLILERMDLDDLLNTAQINGKFSTLAADEFRRKYSHLRIVLRELSPFPNEPNELSNVGMKIDADTIKQIEQINKYVSKHLITPPHINVLKTEVEVENGDQIVNLFKHFGHLIKRLKSINFSSTPPLKSELIGKLVNKYSCESLVDVVFVHNPEKMLKHITNPLINVQSVTLIGNYPNFNCQTIRLDNLFPALHRLSFDSVNNFDFAHFDYRMPHLEHVFIELTLSRGSPFPAFFVKNSQIQSIDFDRVDPEVVRKASYHLPQLETIKLSNFQLRSGSIQFKNVTTFVIDFGHFTSPRNLHFPRLLTLHVDINDRFAEWLDFLNEHNHLSCLHFKHFNMDETQFQQLTANLTNLVEISLERRTDTYGNRALSTNVIVEFLRSHGNVEHLNVINFPKHYEDELHEQLKHEWSARIISEGLRFDRL